MPAVQLELPFSVIDGGKPEPYMNFRSKLPIPIEDQTDEQPDLIIARKEQE